MSDLPSDEQIAAELAATLMRGGAGYPPVAKIADLTRALRILRIVTRVITAERDRAAACATQIYSQRRLAARVGVTPSTVQRWVEAGRPDPVADARLHRYACLLG